jgi:putative FmdB family regulatory protein
MPLYEYKCKSCGEREEKLEQFEAPTEHDCLMCHEPLGMHRQISSTSFSLAGGGWMASGYESSGRTLKKDIIATKKSESNTNNCASSATKDVATPKEGGESTK